MILLLMRFREQLKGSDEHRIAVPKIHVFYNFFPNSTVCGHNPFKISENLAGI